MNSAIHEYLSQDGEGLRSKGASRVSIQRKLFGTVAEGFHTSALLTDSCPPFGG
jgi:hypothetical protein